MRNERFPVEEINLMQPARVSLLAIAVLFALSDSVRATPQIADEGRYEGKECVVLDYPLEHYWLHHARHPIFDDDTTANRKNYHARWEVRNSRLYLISFDARRKGNPVPIDAVIPGSKLPMLATWYSGRLHIGMHDVAGWEKGKPKYDRLVILELEDGVVVGQTVKRDAAKD